MSEKVLGFKEKDAKHITGKPRFMPDYREINDDKLVPVVSLDWLEKWCKKHETLRDCVDIGELLSAARKEAERE